MTDLRPEDHLRWHRDIDVLVADDPDLATVVTSYGRPQRWTRPPGFPSLVLLILEQQVSLASAAAAYRRVAHRIGTMSPAALLSTTAEQLRADGVSRQKDRYLRSLAKAIQDGVLDLSSLADLTDEQVGAELIRRGPDRAAMAAVAINCSPAVMARLPPASRSPRDSDGTLAGDALVTGASNPRPMMNTSSPA